MAPKLDSFHDLVDQVERVFLSPVGQMEIDHRGLELAVTEITLDCPDDLKLMYFWRPENASIPPIFFP